MSFSAQFHPEDVERVRAHRETFEATDYRAERVVYFVGVSLDNGNMATLAGEDPATMRALLTSMLAGLDAIDPTRGDQDDALTPARFDDKPTWAAAAKDGAAQVASDPAAPAAPGAPASPPKPGGAPAFPAAPSGVPLEIPKGGERA